MATVRRKRAIGEPCAEVGNPIEVADIAISFYENAVPSFVEVEMERLYENIFSSIAKFTADGATEPVSTYVVRKDGQVSTVFLFRRRNQKVEVINEAIRIDEEEIWRFADAVFTEFSAVTVISFHAIQAAISRHPFPYQRFNCLEDIVLSLPTTAETYLASLGKNMRAHIKRYMKKLERDFPSFHYQIYVKEDVSAQHIREIIGLSNARMAVKNKISLHDEKKTEQLIRLVKKCGLVVIATIGGRICAGVICSRYGPNYFMHVIAHDPAYDDYRLGKLCCYRTICECIDRAGKEFHFLWGRYEYKYKLLGVQQELDHIAIYRSRSHLLINGDMALKVAFKGYGRQVKRWLLDPKRSDNFIAQFALKFVDSVRNWKGLSPGTVPREK